MVTGTPLDNEHDILIVENMISKKVLTVISLIGSLSFITFLFAKELGLCVLINSSCTETFDQIAENVFVFIPLLIFSLITYKMREEVYQAWFRFVRWWIPISIILIFISPEYSHDWLYPIEKGSVAFLTSAIFGIVSLIIISAKYISLRRKT